MYMNSVVITTINDIKNKVEIKIVFSYRLNASSMNESETL